MNQVRRVFFDSAIIAHTAKDMAEEAKAWLSKEGLSAVINAQQAIELSRAPTASIQRIGEFLGDCRFGIFTDKIFDAEYGAHPALVDPDSLVPLEEVDTEQWLNLLRGEAVQDAWEEEKPHGARLKERFNELKANFPTDKNDNYTWAHGRSYAERMTRQIIEYNGCRVPDAFDHSVFKSICVASWVKYSSWYRDNREPNSGSDLGDHIWLQVVPYCDVAVVEKDLANLFRKIKRNVPDAPIPDHVLTLKDLRAEVA